MQHVILARVRRRHKKHIKAVIFLLAVLSLLIGIALALKEQHSIDDIIARGDLVALDESSDEYSDDSIDENDDIDDTAQQERYRTSFINYVTDLITQSALIAQYKDGELTDESQIATSYDDELTDQDDEVEEGFAQTSSDGEKLPEEAEKILNDLIDVADQAIRIQNQFSYTVTREDKLQDVLDQSGLNESVAKKLIAQYPALANLRAGQQFYWVLDNDGELEYLNWLFSEKEERIFERQSNGKFAYQSIKKKGVWKTDVVRGTIQTNFTTSLKGVGLSIRQINQLAIGLQPQIATNKLKKGDKFAILVKREYINGKVTELGNVEGIHIINNKKSYFAIQASNGKYYSRHGETISGKFSRHPLLFPARVTSSFNPKRLHPITKKVTPHKGVDYGVPVGTPIISPSDGVVEHVAFQAHGAGRYIKIKHGHITTVYMHLSKTLVKPGQLVKKGERIALSGNTGGSTGPHLHYEFHINGHPVDPITIKLPGSNSGMSNKERQEFLKRSKYVQAKLKM